MEVLPCLCIIITLLCSSTTLALDKFESNLSEEIASEVRAPHNDNHVSSTITSFSEGNSPQIGNNHPAGNKNSGGKEKFTLGVQKISKVREPKLSKERKVARNDTVNLIHTKEIKIPTAQLAVNTVSSLQNNTKIKNIATPSNNILNITQTDIHDPNKNVRQNDIENNKFLSLHTSDNHQKINDIKNETIIYGTNFTGTFVTHKRKRKRTKILTETTEASFNNVTSKSKLQIMEILSTPNINLQTSTISTRNEESPTKYFTPLSKAFTEIKDGNSSKELKEDTLDGGEIAISDLNGEYEIKDNNDFLQVNKNSQNETQKTNKENISSFNYNQNEKTEIDGGDSSPANNNSILENNAKTNLSIENKNTKSQNNKTTHSTNQRFNFTSELYKHNKTRQSLPHSLMLFDVGSLKEERFNSNSERNIKLLLDDDMVETPSNGTTEKGLVKQPEFQILKEIGRLQTVLRNFTNKSTYEITTETIRQVTLELYSPDNSTTETSLLGNGNVTEILGKNTAKQVPEVNGTGIRLQNINRLIANSEENLRKMELEIKTDKKNINDEIGDILASNKEKFDVSLEEHFKEHLKNNISRLRRRRKFRVDPNKKFENKHIFSSSNFGNEAEKLDNFKINRFNLSKKQRKGSEVEIKMKDEKEIDKFHESFDLRDELNSNNEKKSYEHTQAEDGSFSSPSSDRPRESDEGDLKLSDNTENNSKSHQIKKVRGPKNKMRKLKVQKDNEGLRIMQADIFRTKTKNKRHFVRNGDGLSEAAQFSDEESDRTTQRMDQSSEELENHDWRKKTKQENYGDNLEAGGDDNFTGKVRNSSSRKHDQRRVTTDPESDESVDVS